MTLKLVSGGAPAPEKGAAAWAVRLDRGELDDAETKAFEHWLGEPGNPEAYAEAAAAMHVFNGLDLDLPELAALREEALGDAALAKTKVPSARPPVMRRWMPWAGSALAASIVAALLLVGQPAPQNGQPGGEALIAENGASPSVRVAGDGYRTGIGEQRTFELADGSKVTLNTATEISVDYRAGERIVRLVRGQALFDVAHAANRPFSVIVAGRKVTALGTIFEVRLDKDRLKVTLLQGKVRIDEDRVEQAGVEPPALAVLVPGQQFVATGALPPVVGSVDAAKQTLWRRSLVEFDNETVGAAVAELNRYSATQIVVADSRVAAMRMSGIVKTGDAGEFTTLVGAMLPVASRKNARGDIELYYAP
ncbi:FecR family protein [Sphingopyxis chilensis]|jgi:transmembrane sensor|uniref:FecR family protein n=1 Tax=Sphingopyxis chilensis TaxID=180400 RepID=UPI002DDDB830|nr:FecR domain-containing protein [Sphingopyxis chilensis]